MQGEDFLLTIDRWIKDIEQYHFDQLCIQPKEDSWSLGQVCVHLIASTHFFFSQIAICTSNNENADKAMSKDAMSMFQNNAFPDIIIKGPKSNDDTRQPTSKDEIITSFENLKMDVISLTKQISNSNHNGKTKHPGLHYFNAHEWLQFAFMHFKHHARQKNRIEAHLKTKD